MRFILFLCVFISDGALNLVTMSKIRVWPLTILRKRTEKGKQKNTCS